MFAGRETEERMERNLSVLVMKFLSWEAASSLIPDNKVAASPLMTVLKRFRDVSAFFLFVHRIRLGGREEGGVWWGGGRGRGVALGPNRTYSTGRRGVMGSA